MMASHIAVRGPASAVSARVVAWCLHLPYPDQESPPLPAPLAGLMTPAAPAASILGRKRLLYKQPATLLALCAVHRALALPAGARPSGQRQPRTAVVACCNLGNVGSVRGIADAARSGDFRDVSPLDAPNASSNVVASTVALWFGFGGPNIMVTSGATAGIDGLDIAIRLLRAARADRVILVGTEPDDAVATALRAAPGRAPLRQAAACVVLEQAAPRAAPVRADVVIGPGPLSARGVPAFHPAAAWGDMYGAEGVVGLALAAMAIDAGRAETASVHCGDPDIGLGAASVWRYDPLRRLTLTTPTDIEH